MARFAVGDVVDGFTLVERMPSGGMASVWRATRTDLPDPVVLKIPFLDPGQDVSTIVGFETEAMIHRRLTGPHVPRWIAEGDLAAVPYLAMAFVPGVPLKQTAAAAPLPADEVARIGAEIATALADLHRQGVVHLDLKPENVILGPEGAVLLDFGLARHASLPDLLGEESTVPMGTAAFIAPEQVLGDRSDPASDVFALGCLLSLLATGEEPFGRPTTVAGMKRRLFHAPKRLRAANPAMPAWLDTVVARCLEVDRGRRYADAAKVAFDLRHPEQIVVAAPAETVTVADAGARGWLAGLFKGPPDEKALVGASTAARRVAGPSIILTAVDLSHGSNPLSAAVLAETARLLAARPDSAVACLTVLRTEILGTSEEKTDAAGRSAYLARLVELRDWARPLRLPDERISFHVIEAVSAADAILRYAEHNHIDHIVIGARSASAMRRHLGSVSTKVVAEAHCSVSVVRVREGVAAAGGQPAGAASSNATSS